MKLIHRFGRLAGVASDHVIGWLLLISVALNVTQVFTRYVMNDPLFWTEEMVRYTTVWLTFVGAAAASLYGDHMDMNLFLEVKNRRFQAFHQAFLQIVILAFCVLIIWRAPSSASSMACRRHRRLAFRCCTCMARRWWVVCCWRW